MQHVQHVKQSFYSRTSMYSFFVVVVLFMTMYIGTEQFTHIKMTQLGYIISTYIFAIGITVRLCSWLIRPSTRTVVKRSLYNLKQKKRTKRNIGSILKTAFDNIILQKFIFKRGLYRGLQHFLIAWGCLGSFAITFGLVLGWMHFELVNPDIYALVVFGVTLFEMSAHGWIAKLIYNGLNFTSLMLLIGLLMAIVRRHRDRELKVTQRGGFDLFPLYLLLAVTVSGLLLTLSYKFLGGFFHYPMSYIHQITVIVLLLYFPFGKLFHLPIRPLATAVPMNYQEEGLGNEVQPQVCRGCGEVYSSAAQIEDVKTILHLQAFDFKQEGGGQLADYCLPCRRKMRVMKQLNMEHMVYGPVTPIDTHTCMSIPGFSRKQNDDQ